MPKKTTVTAVINHLLKAGDSVMSLFSGLLAAMLILYSSYVLYDSFYTQNAAFASGWDLAQYRPEIIEDGAVPLAGGDMLAEINKDYRAWLTLYETNIDYPVMQGPDDVYYSSRNIYGEPSLTGSIYLATGNTKDFSDQYNLIYGHHMDNKAMFGGLDLYLDEPYFDTHREGIIVTADKVYDLKAFAVLKTNAYEEIYYSVGPTKATTRLLSTIKAGATIYKDEVPAGAKIVALSTCAGATTSGRLIVFFIATERDMTPVVTPSNPEINPVSPPGTPPNNPVIPNPNTEEVEPIVVIHDPEIPQHFMHLFNPRGIIYGVDCWALINLICLILTVYLLLPILHLRAKFRRDKLMTDANEGYENLNTEAPYQVSKFKKQFRLGIILEIILALCSIILFIVTENMKLPMVLIDRWTPLMIILLVLCWVVDIQLIRYQEKLKTQEN